ncbi:MAG: hypothetical protein M1816_005769 [Peltula sp. TS41687]|nr:MAG: hypothetical protein M1816_005769 [Peltula sp. TS41687]
MGGCLSKSEVDLVKAPWELSARSTERTELPAGIQVSVPVPSARLHIPNVYITGEGLHLNKTLPKIPVDDWTLLAPHPPVSPAPRYSVGPCDTNKETISIRLTTTDIPDAAPLVADEYELAQACVTRAILRHLAKLERGSGYSESPHSDLLCDDFDVVFVIQGKVRTSEEAWKRRWEAAVQVASRCENGDDALVQIIPWKSELPIKDCVIQISTSTFHLTRSLPLELIIVTDDDLEIIHQFFGESLISLAARDNLSNDGGDKQVRVQFIRVTDRNEGKDIELPNQGCLWTCECDALEPTLHNVINGIQQRIKRANASASSEASWYLSAI